MIDKEILIPVLQDSWQEGIAEDARANGFIAIELLAFILAKDVQYTEKILPSLWYDFELYKRGPAAWNWGMEYMNPNLLRPNPCQVKKCRRSEALGICPRKRISGRYIIWQTVRTGLCFWLFFIWQRDEERFSG